MGGPRRVQERSASKTFGRLRLAVAYSPGSVLATSLDRLGRQGGGRDPQRTPSRLPGPRGGRRAHPDGRRAPQSRDASPAETAIASLARYLTVVVEERPRWLAIYSLVDSSTPALRARLAQGQRLVIGAFEDPVRWAVAEQGLDPETDIEMMARMLFAIFWDAGRLVLAEPEDFPAERIVAFGRRVVETYYRPN